jgi:hypothetical protein
MAELTIRKTRMLIKLLLILSLFPGASPAQILQPAAPMPSLQADLKVETSYDPMKDKTTVRLPAVHISGDNGKYRSLHMSPAFTYRGKESRTPDIIDFELRTVVKGRLDSDLYVLFVIDGEKVFLSSNRWAVRRPVPGRVWVGERLVFRMPYETFVKITKAKALELRFDEVKFSLSEEHLRMLRAFGDYIEPRTNPH